MLLKGQKGFTLIELLVTFVVLAVIIGIVVFFSTGTIKDSKKKAYAVSINEIEKSADAYVSGNIDDFVFIDDDKGVYYVCVTVKEIVDYGYLRENIVESEVDDGVYVALDDYVYVARDNVSNSLVKVLYVDKKNVEYIEACKKVPKKKYTISFDANGGSGGQKSKVYAVYQEPMPSITTEAPVRNRLLVCDGWYDTPKDTGGTMYYTKDGVSARNWDKKANTTLYARWRNTIKYWSENPAAHVDLYKDGYNVVFRIDNTSDQKFGAFVRLPGDYKKGQQIMLDLYYLRVGEDRFYLDLLVWNATGGWYRTTDTVTNFAMFSSYNGDNKLTFTLTRDVPYIQFGYVKTDTTGTNYMGTLSVRHVYLDGELLW